MYGADDNDEDDAMTVTITMTMTAIIPNPPNNWVLNDNELSTVLSL